MNVSDMIEKIKSRDDFIAFIEELRKEKVHVTNGKIKI